MKSEDNWLVFKNTQEAIIDEATFETVQKVRGTVRRYPDGWGELHPLTGLMYCADCGAKMYVHRAYNGTRKAQYTCSAYGKVPVASLCPTQHRVSEENVLQLIKELLREIAGQANLDRDAFIQAVREAQEQQESDDSDQESDYRTDELVVRNQNRDCRDRSHAEGSLSCRSADRTI